MSSWEDWYPIEPTKPHCPNCGHVISKPHVRFRHTCHCGARLTFIDGQWYELDPVEDLPFERAPLPFGDAPSSYPSTPTPTPASVPTQRRSTSRPTPSTSQPSRPFVFVSYSHFDNAWCQVFVASLNLRLAPHHGVWFDDGLHAGGNYVTAIYDQLDRCAELVVLMTPSSMMSDWVGNEVAYALAERKPLIPVLVQSCVVIPPLRLAQYIDATVLTPAAAAERVGARVEARM